MKTRLRAATALSLLLCATSPLPALAQTPQAAPPMQPAPAPGGPAQAAPLPMPPGGSMPMPPGGGGGQGGPGIIILAPVAQPGPGGGPMAAPGPGQGPGPGARPMTTPMAQMNPLALPPLPLAPTPESVGVSSRRLAVIRAVLQNEVASGRIAGAVFGIARHGRLADLFAVGERDPATHAPMTVDDVFPLASMTKPIASVALMTLVERGQVFLSDPISKYLPAFKSMKVAVMRPDTTAYDLVPAAREITVQDVLRHTSGMINATLFGPLPIRRAWMAAGIYDPNQTLAQEVDKLATVPLAHQPGTAWDYSQSTDVVARLVEVITGMPFDQYVDGAITTPLRMYSTGFYVPDFARDRLAMPLPIDAAGTLPPHQVTFARPVHIAGNSGLIGSGGDYLRFGEMMLNAGALQGARVLGAGTAAIMASDQLGAIPHNTTESARYLLGPGVSFGLGFGVRMTTGLNPLPGTSGDIFWGGAYGTQFVIDPRREMVAVLMVNQQNEFDRMMRLFRSLTYQALQ